MKNKKPIAIGIDRDGEVTKIYNVGGHWRRFYCLVVLMDNFGEKFKETIECLCGVGQSTFFLTENKIFSEIWKHDKKQDNIES